MNISNGWWLGKDNNTYRCLKINLMISCRIRSAEMKIFIWKIEALVVVVLVLSSSSPPPLYVSFFNGDSMRSSNLNTLEAHTFWHLHIQRCVCFLPTKHPLGGTGVLPTSLPNSTTVTYSSSSFKKLSSLRKNNIILSGCFLTAVALIWSNFPLWPELSIFCFPPELLSER